jgi:hypothetical protein
MGAWRGLPSQVELNQQEDLMKMKRATVAAAVLVGASTVAAMFATLSAEAAPGFGSVSDLDGDWVMIVDDGSDPSQFPSQPNLYFITIDQGFVSGADTMGRLLQGEVEVTTTSLPFQAEYYRMNFGVFPTGQGVVRFAPWGKGGAELKGVADIDDGFTVSRYRVELAKR